MSVVGPEYFNQCVASIENMRAQVESGEVPFITAITTCSAWLDQTAGYYQNLNASDYLASIEDLRGQLVAWMEGYEAAYFQYLDSEYLPSNPADVIKTNLGDIHFRQHKVKGDWHAIKDSKLGSNSSEDPVTEAIYYSFGAKDSYCRILTLLHAKTLSNKFIMITPKAEGGDLFKYITLHPDKVRQNRKTIIAQLVYSLNYLHNHLGVAHLDIKPENVFLDANFMPVLGDFGMARVGDFPNHPHNTSASNQERFWHQHFVAAIENHVLKSRNVDGTQAGVYPRFSLPYHKYLAHRHALVSHPVTVHSQVSDASQMDIENYVGGVSVGAVHGVAAKLKVASLQNLLPPEPTAAPTTAEEDLLALVSPHNTRGVMETFHRLSQYHQQNLTLPTTTTQKLLEDRSFTFRFGYEDYVDLHFAQASGGQPRQALQHMPPNYVPPSRAEFLDYTAQMLQTFFGFTPEMLQAHMWVEFVPNLPPYFYAWLTPDLSTLAQRPYNRSVGTRAYQDPELVFKSRLAYDPFKADIYSLGVVFFIIIFGFPPYREPDVNTDPAFARLYQHAHAPLQPGETRQPLVTKLVNDYGKTGTVHPNVLQLLDRMMCFNPANRCTIKRILTEFLDNLNL